MKNQIHDCNEMKAQLDMSCDLHNDPFDCADRLIIYNSRSNGYGIIIHDGGELVFSDSLLSLVWESFG